MGLLPPSPALASNAVVHTPMRRVDRGKGDRTAAAGTTASYRAIVTMRAQAVGDPLRVRVVGDSAATFWDVLILHATDPGVNPEDLLVDDHGRRLIADAPSTYREAGAYLVVCKELR